MTCRNSQRATSNARALLSLTDNTPDPPVIGGSALSGFPIATLANSLLPVSPPVLPFSTNSISSNTFFSLTCDLLSIFTVGEAEVELEVDESCLPRSGVVALLLLLLVIPVCIWLLFLAISKCKATRKWLVRVKASRSRGSFRISIRYFTGSFRRLKYDTRGY